jgi:hypothetical protein
MAYAHERVTGIEVAVILLARRIFVLLLLVDVVVVLPTSFISVFALLERVAEVVLFAIVVRRVVAPMRRVLSSRQLL